MRNETTEPPDHLVTCPVSRPFTGVVTCNCRKAERWDAWNKQRTRTMTPAQCARTGHATTVEVLGGLACGCGLEFEIQCHVSARRPERRVTGGQP